MNAAAHAQQATDRAMEQALRGVARDLRQFVTKLQRPRLGDGAWRKAATERCCELSERIAALRDSAVTQRETLHRSLQDLRRSLQEYSAEFSDRSSVQRLREMRAALSRHYEDLVAHLKASRLAAAEDPELRALRIPRFMRTAMHVALGVTCVFLYQFVLDRSGAFLALGIALGIFLTLEITRRFSRSWNDFLCDKLFGSISRPRERYQVNSATFYLSGMALITWFAPQAAVCTALLVLAFADPAAMIVGTQWGRKKLYGDKSVAGTAAFFVVGAAMAFLYLTFIGTPASPLARLGIAAAVAAVGAVAELFGGKLDDNFAIPVACATVGLLLL